MLRRVGEQRGTLHAYRAEQRGIGKGKAQRAIASHGHSGDAAVAAARAHAILALDERHEFLEEEIAVADFGFICVPLGNRVDVKAAPALRGDDKEIANLVLLAQVLDQLPGAGVNEGLLVVAESMQKIEHGILFAGVEVVGCGQQHAIVNGLAQNAALDVGTVNAALGGERCGR